MSIKAQISELAGVDLKNFKILEMTEVFKVDDDGRCCSSLGFFKDAEIAADFAGAQKDSSYFKTGPAFVLTNGEVGFTISGEKEVKLFDDEKEAGEIRKRGLAKLTAAERKVLRL
jgi:hypothetical protein